MSMLWVPQNPRGYSLMNVFYPKAGGAMVIAILPKGRPLWLAQIRDNFLHCTSESLVAYANAILGETVGTILTMILALILPILEEGLSSSRVRILMNHMKV
ncbi:hypothetical protein Hanom_Chr09g00790431 [Helianthus anomalus]